MLDFEPAATQLARLVGGITDEQLDVRTPCEFYTLGDLVDHVNGLSLGFAYAATKTLPPGGSKPPSGDASRLAPDWRTRIPEQLDALAETWRDPAAWEGMTTIGGVDMPGRLAGSFGLNECVVHGWDISRATGQPFDADPAAVDACIELLSQGGGREGIFAAPVEVDEAAPALDRLIGLSGRDPSWTPPETSPDPR
jgi:uncharacterized protein (TIGR03086 family)